LINQPIITPYRLLQATLEIFLPQATKKTGNVQTFERGNTSPLVTFDIRPTLKEETVKIRSITVFAELDADLDASRVAELGAFARAARSAFTEAGFEVQTTRLATHLFPLLKQSEWADRPADFAAKLEPLIRDWGFDYLALGPADAEMLPALPEIFAATEATFASAHLVNSSDGAINGETLRAAAYVIHRAATLDAGFGNLRFAALANVPPGTPFFPAAYYGGGPATFAIATEAADLAVNACTAVHDTADAQTRLVLSLEDAAERLVPVAERLTGTHGLGFGGIDFSLAPFPADTISIGAALESLTGQLLGSAGTLSAAAMLTDAIERAHFPHVGFCGLMLPVLEDPVLAQRAAEGRLQVNDLLQWSAVCGTGLDTVPLPGDAAPESLARLLFDVAALSVRLNKPLTARLMPLPGKKAGDPVHFDFAYFADGGVLPLDGGGTGPLFETQSLSLGPIRRPA
jgi:hypothetical protein